MRRRRQACAWCTTATSRVPPDGVCVNVGVEIESYRYDASVEASCDAPHGGEPQGEVTSRPVTVCCSHP
jgi:hypothetical protein